MRTSILFAICISLIFTGCHKNKLKDLTPISEPSDSINLAYASLSDQEKNTMSKLGGSWLSDSAVVHYMSGSGSDSAIVNYNLDQDKIVTYKFYGKNQYEISMPGTSNSGFFVVHAGVNDTIYLSNAAPLLIETISQSKLIFRQVYKSTDHSGVSSIYWFYFEKQN